AVKREEGGSLEAAEVERSARTRPASGDSSSSGPPTKRSRIASQPITERETAPATASNNSSAPANNDENGINDQESGPSSSPSQRQPNSAVAAASPTSACAGEVSAALLGVPYCPRRSSRRGVLQPRRGRGLGGRLLLQLQVSAGQGGTSNNRVETCWHSSSSVSAGRRGAAAPSICALNRNTGRSAT
ncbi:unnamed protein product, partial [Ectocarpus fasciculatus]